MASEGDSDERSIGGLIRIRFNQRQLATSAALRDMFLCQTSAAHARPVPPLLCRRIIQITPVLHFYWGGPLN